MLFSASQLRLILRLQRHTLSWLRDISILALGTMCALRPSEILRLDVCDVLSNIDGIGTLAVCIWFRFIGNDKWIDPFHGVLLHVYGFLLHSNGFLLHVTSRTLLSNVL